MSPGKMDFYAKEVTDAIKKACDTLKVPQEELAIDVVDTGSMGIFGLIRKKAHIRASVAALDVEDAKKGLEMIKKFSSALNESNDTPEKILRSHGYKIKLVAPTKFGTQIDFAKKYEDADIKKVLKGFTLKFDGKSVFVID